VGYLYVNNNIVVSLELLCVLDLRAGVRDIMTDVRQTFDSIIA